MTYRGCFFGAYNQQSNGVIYPWTRRTARQLLELVLEYCGMGHVIIAICPEKADAVVPIYWDHEPAANALAKLLSVLELRIDGGYIVEA